MQRFLSFSSLALLAAASAPRAQGNFTPCTHVLHTFEGEAVGDWFGFVSAPIPDGNGEFTNGMGMLVGQVRVGGACITCVDGRLAL